MNEAQDFREKRLAEMLARALVEAIRQMQDASTSATAAASVSEPVTSQVAVPSPGPASRQSELPTGTSAPALGPPETRRADERSPGEVAASKAWSEPLTPPVNDLAAWHPVLPWRQQDAPPEPTPIAPPELPQAQVTQVREPEPARPPVTPRYLPLEPIEVLEPVGPMSSRDPLGDQARTISLDQRARAYDETVGMVANSRLEYDTRFRDYRRTEYEVTERVMRDLAEDQRRLESLYRAFASCRGTITDANV